MIRASIAALLFITLSGNAAAHDPMTGEQMTLQGAMWGLQVIDLGQSRSFARQKNADGSRQYHEINPIMGQNPSDAQLRNTVIGSMIGHAVITYVLPNDWRNKWLYGTVALELAFVGNNARIGLKIHL